MVGRGFPGCAWSTWLHGFAPWSLSPPLGSLEIPPIERPCGRLLWLHACPLPALLFPWGAAPLVFSGSGERPSRGTQRPALRTCAGRRLAVRGRCGSRARWRDPRRMPRSRAAVTAAARRAMSSWAPPLAALRPSLPAGPGRRAPQPPERSAQGRRAGAGAERRRFRDPAQPTIHLVSVTAVVAIHLRPDQCFNELFWCGGETFHPIRTAGADGWEGLKWG